MKRFYFLVITILLLHNSMQSQNQEIQPNSETWDFLSVVSAAVPAKQLHGYQVLQFSALPSPATLRADGIHPVQYVASTTIIAYLTTERSASSIKDLHAYGSVPSALKMRDLQRTGTGKQWAIVEGYPGTPQRAIEAVLKRHGLVASPNRQIQGQVCLTHATYEQLQAVAADNQVCWVHIAPASLFTGETVHYCPGAATEYGTVSRFATVGPGWDGNGLGCAFINYFFENQTNDIAGTQEWDAVRAAMMHWTNVADVNFIETTSADRAGSIDIGWYAGDHGDGSPFDGPGNVLAHAFYPAPPYPEPIAGDLHFDEAETWSLTGNFHQFTVALHELGHSLGLNHSTVSGAVMQAFYAGPVSGLHADDIAGIRSLYGSRQVVTGENDPMLIGDINGDNREDITFVNRSYRDGAVRSVDVISGANLAWHSHCDFDGWMDSNDYIDLADANGNGTKELILVNTSYTDGAIRTFNIQNGTNLLWLGHGTFSGWLDPSDKHLIGDVDGNGTEDLILINTGYAGGAIRAIDLTTGGNLAWINHGTFGGWMDAGDHLTIGDANGDGKADVILVNTGYSGGAIRAVDVMTGTTLITINHGAFGGWMDAGDRLTCGDMNGDGKDDLILINTFYSGGAMLSISLTTGATLSLISHGSFGGWLDACDQSFLNDVNGDGSEELILVNTGYAGGTIRALNLVSGANLALINYSSVFNGWMDSNDRMASADVDADGGDLVMVNTDYTGGAIRTFNILNGSTIGLLYHGSYSGWMDGTDANSNCVNPPVFKQLATDTQDAAPDATWKLVPNPTDTKVTILPPAGTPTKAQIKIVANDGRIVYTMEGEGAEFHLDLSEIAKGLYHVQILENGIATTQRLIIQ